MTTLQNSKFETYLMDQEPELQENVEESEDFFKQVRYEEFPEGFFTSL